MSGEQIRLQILTKLFRVNRSSLDPAQMIDQAANSKLLVRRQKMHGFQRCCGELAELTVDDIWQIADVGDQEFRRLALCASVSLCSLLVSFYRAACNADAV